MPRVVEPLLRVLRQAHQAGLEPGQRPQGAGPREPAPGGAQPGEAAADAAADQGGGAGRPPQGQDRPGHLLPALALAAGALPKDPRPARLPLRPPLRRAVRLRPRNRRQGRPAGPPPTGKVLPRRALRLGGLGGRGAGALRRLVHDGPARGGVAADAPDGGALRAVPQLHRVPLPGQALQGGQPPEPPPGGPPAGLQGPQAPRPAHRGLRPGGLHPAAARQTQRLGAGQRGKAPQRAARA
mmetsp:Transcript_25947/g.58187  ORF Transcript_25947/g.58187 Transcript_25947/m.58187 type:complete len:240 (-) Transcript_25947:604-1323(-)